MRAAGTGALAFTILTLAGAAVGGGWIALGRVDPLLSVPGMMLAALLSCAIVRGKAPLLLDVAAKSVVLAPALAATALVLAGQLPAIALALAVAAAVIAICVAQPVTIVIHRLWQSRRVLRRVVAAGVAVLTVACWQYASWAMLPRAYATPALDERVRVGVLSSLDWQDGLVDSELAPDFDLALLPTLSSPILLSGDQSAGWQPPPAFPVMAWTDTLLLAHPGALTPAELVAIDGWVRRGGRVVVLADGLSSAPPRYPLGDPRNPPVTSLLTPLLDHWGVRLDAPAGLNATVDVIHDAGERLALLSAGRLTAVPGSGCRVSGESRVARCRIGRGWATIMSDADWLVVPLWAGTARHPTAVNWRAGNVDWMAHELGWRREGDRPSAWTRPLWVR